MILDKDTNKVYFSKYLTAYKCWGEIEKALKEHGVAYELMPGTKDIWARDYMPVQIAENEFVDYIYNPDYLQKEKPYITSDVSKCYDFSGKDLKRLDVVIDGGNVIKCDGKIIMTDKVFLENKSMAREEVVKAIEDATHCELVVIPWDKAEDFGHADGMVRYVEPGHVVINNYSDIDKPLRGRLFKALRPHFAKISELEYGRNARKKSWAHLNFLQIGNVIFVPLMGIASDAMALEQLGTIYKDCKIVPIEVEGIVKKGGALNCVSWNVK